MPRAHATDRFINGTRAFIVRSGDQIFLPRAVRGARTPIAIKNTPKDDQVPRFTWRYGRSLLDFLGESGASMLAQIRQSIRDPLRFFCLLFVFLLFVLFRRTKAGNVAGRRNRDERGNKGPRCRCSNYCRSLFACGYKNTNIMYSDALRSLLGQRRYKMVRGMEFRGVYGFWRLFRFFSNSCRYIFLLRICEWNWQIY